MARRWLALAAAATAVVAAAYGWAARRLGLSALATLRWIRGADHGFSYPRRWYNPLAALYGLGKSLVYAPYPEEASPARLVALVAAGMAVLGLLVVVIVRAARRGELPAARRAWPLLLAWALPYALVAVLYFGSDTERWVFVVPAIWLVAAEALAGASAPRWLGPALVGGLLAVNVAAGAVPPWREDGPGRRADLVAASVGDRDLVVIAGHGWDEHIGTRRPLRAEVFQLAYWAGRLGAGATLERLDRRMAACWGRGGRVIAVRLAESDDQGSDRRQGWKDLERLGLDRARVVAHLGLDRWKIGAAAEPPGRGGPGGPIAVSFRIGTAALLR